MAPATDNVSKVSDRIQTARSLDEAVTWGAKLAPVFIAIPMAIFGVQHFIYLQFVADFIPAWIPWHTFWACFTGAALIASAVGIVFRIWDRWAATLLGSMILLWVLLLHTSRIAINPGDFGEWRGIFQALAMSGCGFILSAFLTRRKSTVLTQPTATQKLLSALSEWGAKASPYFIGVSMVALGVQHFVFAEVNAPQVPVWIPGTTLGNYLTGAVLIGLGTLICFEVSRWWSSALLGMVIFLSMLMVHLPVVLKSTRFESDWTKTFVLSGGAILLAALAMEKGRGNALLPANVNPLGVKFLGDGLRNFKDRPVAVARRK
jgi:uncharacterized membrane protein